jgi:hypothetical protein
MKTYEVEYQYKGKQRNIEIKADTIPQAMIKFIEKYMYDEILIIYKK